MLKILLFCLSVSLIGCNAPLEDRQGVQIYGDASSDASNGGADSNQDQTFSNPVGNNNNPVGNVNNLGSGYQNCVLDAIHVNQTLGPLGICQNSINLKSFAMYFTTSSMAMNDATCFIPMYRQTNGASVPLGMAQCTTHYANDVKQAYLATNSPQPINGVMILKRSGVESFFGCMQTYNTVYNARYQQYLQQFQFQGGQAQAQQKAHQDAAAEQSYVCGLFKQNHHYIDIALPPVIPSF